MEEDVSIRDSATPSLELHFVKAPLSRMEKEHKQTGSTQESETNAISKTLIECSEVEDDVVSTIICNDWREAVVGWRPTVPCVKYAWHEPKKHHSDGHGDNRKNKTNGKPQKHPPKEINWRCTVEPGTYRYSPGGFHRKILEVKPQLETHVSEERKLLMHLERVRDHFERTLKCANKPIKFSNCKEKSETGESTSPRRSFSEGAVKGASSVKADSRRKSRHEQEESNVNEKVSTEGVRNIHNYESEKSSHNLQRYQVHKVEINNPFSDLKSDQTSQISGRLKLTHAREAPMEERLMLDNLNSWGILNSSLLHETDLPFNLNPLKKVTPQQRLIRDDNEAAIMHTSSRSGDESDGQSIHATLLGEDYSPFRVVSMEKEKHTTEKSHYEQLCFHLDPDSEGNQSNMDTLSQFSQKEFSLAKELQSVQEILQTQKLLNQQLKKTPNRKRYKPHKLRAIPPHSLKGAGDIPDDSRSLGEPLHRGIMDRKTAADLATELLPGVNGQRLNPPLYANRIV
ncbi:hypothetical protein HOLleu_12711 [Holothuria leucospilota]|uniref:Uncharacterized protein n=1 Tax=Holothuria leucospilota TaxID=206669 RepID=A0A9Q1HE21_HOLLE|nr:hypothetical protein HOLleu_12711 [Holothuria leucospilota]